MSGIGRRITLAMTTAEEAAITTVIRTADRETAAELATALLTIRRLLIASARWQELQVRVASEFERKAVTHARPRCTHFKEAIIQAFYAGVLHQPETTFWNVKSKLTPMRTRLRPADAAISATPGGITRVDGGVALPIA
jgi:hypothetical protein